MRVGLIIGQLTTGGAEGQLRMLCEGFDRTAVSPIVYCLSAQTEPNGTLLQDAGIPVRVIAGGQLDRTKRLRRVLVADRIDVVHTWLFIANAYGWAANFGAPRALVTSARNCKRQGRLLDALNRRAFNASDAIIVNSTEVQHYIEQEYAAPPQRITVIPNAIDLQRFCARSRPQGAHVITVGRLVKQKNPLLFVAAAAALHGRLPATRFTLVGDGPMREQVDAAIRAAGLTDVCRLAGERSDVHELLGEADLFWLTSDWEGLPNALIEALASGLPVVVTDVGGTRDLVDDGEEGFVVQPQDGAAIVRHSLAVLSDPGLRNRMSAAARRRAERFGVGQMVRATQAVYERALVRRAA